MHLSRVLGGPFFSSRRFFSKVKMGSKGAPQFPYEFRPFALSFSSVAVSLFTPKMPVVGIFSPGCFSVASNWGFLRRKSPWLQNRGGGGGGRGVPSFRKPWFGDAIARNYIGFKSRWNSQLFGPVRTRKRSPEITSVSKVVAIPTLGNYEYGICRMKLLMFRELE